MLYNKLNHLYVYIFPIPLFKNLFLIEGLLLYNIVLVSAVQDEPAICVHVLPHSWLSQHPHPICVQSILHRALAELPGLYSIFPLSLCFTHASMYLSVLLSQFIPVLYVCVSSLTLKVRPHILKLHLFLPLMIWLCPINHKVWKLPLLGPFILSLFLMESKDHDSSFDT